MSADTSAGAIFVGQASNPNTYAQAREPPRADHRRDRHRQDRDAADHRRGLFARRRSGVLPPTSRAISPASRQRASAKDFLRQARRGDRLRRLRRTKHFPAIFWDLFGEQGHPIRTTVSEMGPLLLARLLDLNDTQEGVLNIAFRIADEEGLLLLDLKDLQALLARRRERGSELHDQYGNVSTAHRRHDPAPAAGAREAGRRQFFGEPALDIDDLMRTTPDGRGFINMLAADKLMASPRLYATFLLWLLSELFEELPEVGDPDKPKLVFFFDEAHLLFDDAPKALLDKVEQVVRLIRSKGVGVYFVTQNPLDVPETVLASSATACSMRCAPSRRATRRR